jgi:hypothetical protein
MSKGFSKTSVINVKPRFYAYDGSFKRSKEFLNTQYLALTYTGLPENSNNQTKIRYENRFAQIPPVGPSP